MWSELDARAIACSRGLAADAVQHVGHGHPGTAMALAPAAYLLFQRHLRHNPANAQWVGRDRFVLSAGHTSLTLYTQLYLSGYGLEMDDLMAFRTLDSLTPAHPEYGHTVGVETTTGPLGQGVAMAVGMAIASERVHAVTGSRLFDPTIWVLAGDGCLQEGVSAEASSLAGHLALGNLVLIYDDNRISIDGDTNLSFSEDVSARYRAYGWDVLEVPLADDGDIDVLALDVAMTAARLQRSRPTLIRMRSTIAWPAPKSRNTAKSHGSPLGDDDIAAAKLLLGLDPSAQFQMPEDVLRHAREVRARGVALEAEWRAELVQWRTAEIERAAAYDDLFTSAIPGEAFPQFAPGSKLATRQASGVVLNAIARQLPRLFGGSADLSESNQTLLDGLASYSRDNRLGRNLHFGIREHAMGAIMNGVALFGFHAYGGTFLVFAPYMLGAIRLSALMQTHVTYVLTHDSIGLGEDGPTHQPIETLWTLRALPDFAVIRPADANETAAAWRLLIAKPQPAALVLSRQAIATVSTAQLATGVARGAYVVRDASDAEALIVATGSEVAIALEAAERLQEAGVMTHVVSAPCLEWFDEQDQAYRDSVLPPAITNRVSLEAGATLGWHKYVKTPLGIDHFGASGAAHLLYQRFGLTADDVIAAVLANRA